MKISRRKWLARLAVYGTPAAAFGYGSLIERHRLSITEQTIPLSERFSHLAGLKVAVMGDFHHDDWGSDRLLRATVKEINNRDVDAAILVGDYATLTAARSALRSTGRFSCRSMGRNTRMASTRTATARSS